MTVADCETVGELLAWHANGTLGPADRAIVDAHTEECDTCRTTLALERRIVESIRAPRGNVEQAPHASWQKLRSQIDTDTTSPHHRKQNRAATAAPVTTAPAPLPVRRRMNWSAALGAAVAVQAAAIAVLAIALVRHRQIEEAAAPRFHTLAAADPTLASSGQLVRIAFDAGVDESSARRVAEEVSGSILAGPSPENVYTFVFQSAPATGQSAPATGRSIDDKVSWLRHQAHVLLVEPVVLGLPAARKP